MANYVPAEGRHDARIVLVGEAPGKWENASRRPFVGPSGQRLTEWWSSNGLKRSDFYITNVHKYQPRANKIETVPKAELAGSIDTLLDELAGLTQPYVIVPTGNTALRAITGRSSILKWRGSILCCSDRRGREVKVIPTIHPAATFRSSYLEKRCRIDWKRIAEEALTPTITLPEREHFINPTLSDVASFCAEAAQQAEALAIDIETPRKVRAEYVRTTKKGKAVFRKIRDERHLAMVGFATGADFSFTIPTTLAYWHDLETLEIVWDYIRSLCESDTPKILQNGMFDSFWLKRVRDIDIRNYQWDCLAMHHAIDSCDEHSLAYMASVDTREPYWKQSGKDNDEDNDDPESESSTGNFDEYQTYNGKDCCVEYELADLYAGRLTDLGLLSFYRNHYMHLIEPLLALTIHGIGVDIPAMNRRYARLMAECITIQDRLTVLAGEPLYTKKSLSTKKVQRFLYDTLKLPKQFKTKRIAGQPVIRTVTVDEIALRRMAIKHARNPSATMAIGDILDHRRKFQLSSFLSNAPCDSDNRMRCTYKFTTEFNRLASSKNPHGTGRNLQNLDREVLDVFVPDDGCIMLEVDLSQAEDRVVKVLAYAITGDTDLLQRAQSKPWENDEHRRAASAIFGVTLTSVTKEQRYLGKRARHASNYGMHGNTLSEQLLKEGYTYTPEECQAMIDRLIAAEGYVLEYQKATRHEIITNHRLTNSWGRIWDVQYERLSDDLYRRGYAFRPQSDVGMLLNQYGLRPAHDYIKHYGLRARINLQMHDALKISCPPDEALEIAAMLKQSLERPRWYGPVKLSIPVEMKLGLDAAGLIEFKEFKPKEFEAAAYEVASKLPAVLLARKFT